MNRYEIIIFDFDGTLGDSLSWFGETINTAAKRFNFRVISEEEKEKLREEETKNIMSYLGISWWKVPFIAAFMRKEMKRQLSKVQLFPGIKELLEALSHQNYQLALVSSNSYSNVASVLGSELMGRFSFIECGSSVFGKPAKFQKILKKARGKRSVILAIGDEVRDIEAAREVGIDCGAVTWGYAKEKALADAKADYFFHSTNDILKLLDR